MSRDEVAQALAFGVTGRLGLLRLPQPLRDRLFATYAPIFEVDEAGGDDRIGAPAWEAAGRPAVDASLPLVHTHLAHTQYRGRLLPQLVYVAWFAGRPAAFPGDPLAGRLDALFWRVTLAPDGAPLIFDSIHACGCYHLFFPTARATPLTLPATLDETAFVPQHLPEMRAGERAVLRVAAATHYLQRIGLEPAGPAIDAHAPVGPSIDAHAPAAAERSYVLQPLDTLRSLPLPAGGRRSLFGPDGIVPGTERAERFLFWPMGIPSAGAMRQWGRHATAFVGRRHFDQPDLLERAFVLR